MHYYSPLSGKCKRTPNSIDAHISRAQPNGKGKKMIKTRNIIVPRRRKQFQKSNEKSAHSIRTELTAKRKKIPAEIRTQKYFYCKYFVISAFEH